MKIEENAPRLRSARVARRTLGAMTLAMVMVFASVLPAHADYYSGGMPSTKFNVKYSGINSTWTGYFNDARTRWNNTSGTGVSIGKSSSAAATMTAARYSQDWYGLYTYSGLRSLGRSFTIKVNARSLSEAAGSNLSKWIASGSAPSLVDI